MDSPSKTFIRTLRVRLKDKHANECRALARWVNTVWNYDNELAGKVFGRERRFMRPFDFHQYTKGLAKEGCPLHSQTVQAINEEFATRAKQFKKVKLRWRVSNRAHSKYSLGWIPLKGSAIRYKQGQLCISGFSKPLSVWDSYELSRYKDRIVTGSVTEDARGRWYANLQVRVDAPIAQDAPMCAVGLDLGLKDAAVASDGRRLDARYYRPLEQQLAMAQRAKKKVRVRALHAKIKNLRREAMHQFSRALADEYGFVFVGHVSTQSQIKSGRAKSVLDAGWGQLKTMLRYKCQWAGAWFEEVSEAFSTQTCSCCSTRTGPKGLKDLGIREWTCCHCGAIHDRDVNAAWNILAAGHGRLDGGIPVL
jgi:putative transposase